MTMVSFLNSNFKKKGRKEGGGKEGGRGEGRKEGRKEGRGEGRREKERNGLEPSIFLNLLLGLLGATHFCFLTYHYYLLFKFMIIHHSEILGG